MNKDTILLKEKITELSKLFTNLEQKITPTELASLLNEHLPAKVIQEIQSNIENDEYIKNVINNSPFPIAVVDTDDQNIRFWSKTAIELFGHNPKTTEEWYKLAYPDPTYRQEVIERWKPFLEAAKKSIKAINTGE